VRYGDTIEFVDFDYMVQVARLDLVTLVCQSAVSVSRFLE
jgi:hypothetical protein